MKLNISNSGIYDPIKNDLEDAITNLNNAKSILTSPPASFSQSGYMSSLPSKINNLIRKVTNLSNSALRIDQKYKDYILDKKTKFNSIDDYTLNERIGLSDQFQMSSSKYNVNSEIIMNESGMLVFKAIASATGIKSALDHGSSNIKDSNEQPSKEEKAYIKGTPDTVSIETDEPIDNVPKEPVIENPTPSNGNGDIPGTHSPGTMERSYQAQAYNLSPEEYKVLCATVYAEAAEGNEYTYSDTMGVTSSILNRVEAGNWGGSSVTEVVSAPNQFEGYGYQNQKFSRAMNDPSCISPEMMQAINDTLAGRRNTEGYSFYGNGTHNAFR